MPGTEPPAASAPRGPFAGCSILVTRAPHAARGLVERLRSLGADAEAHSSIAVLPPADLAPARRAIEDLSRYDWIVFTSANGVERFLALCHEAGVGRPAGVAVAAVGPATASALGAAGWATDLVADSGDGAGLGRGLAVRLGPGARVLLVRPEVAAEALPAALDAVAVETEHAVVYRTVAAPDAVHLVGALLAGRYDAAVFTAPSTFDRLLEVAAKERDALLAALGDMTLVAIGRTTAAAIEAAGLAVAATADEPTDAGIVRALEGVLPSLSASRHRRARALRDRRPPAAPGSPRRGPIEEIAVSTDEQLKRTPLHDLHVAAGARMVPFAGWHMPVQYSGVVDEHNAVRTAAGLFDVSHMGEAFVSGAGALAFLQHVTCNNVAKLQVGRAQYNALTTPAGTFVDDLLVYRTGEASYMLVLNAGNAAKDVAWLSKHMAGFDATLDDRSDATALLAVQGPRAAEILRDLVAADLDAVRYYGFVEAEVTGFRCIVSRTGYTGEDGFEIFCPADAATAIWNAVTAAGLPHGLKAVGLAARDTLRLEACMALYGNDIDDTTTVLEADLGWILKLGKGEFIGREALQRQSVEGVRRKLVGFEVEGRAIARHGYPALHDGREVGRVTSGTFAPFLKKSVGLVYLPVGLTEPGTAFGIGVRDRTEPARVVPTPFYRRPGRST